MRRDKVVWTWAFGATANQITFFNNRNVVVEREGYTADTATELCRYLNSRG
jgi:hypothetical protein